MPHKQIHTDQAPAAIGPYSQGIVANGFLFTAGQIALDPGSGQIVAGDVVAQTEQGRGILGVVDGSSPKGMEGPADVEWRHGLLRKIGYKR